MIVSYINKIFWFLGLVLLQVLVLNNVHIGGLATPFLYIYLILRFDSTVSRNELMLWGFFLGLAVDIFSNTPGMNAAATVLLAFIRPLFLRLFTPRDNEELIPSLKNLGFSSFTKYLLVVVFIHHLSLFIIASFSFADIHMLLLQVVCSTLLTVTCVLAIEGIRS